jgi:hypothetical protein
MESHYTEVTDAVPAHAVCVNCEGVIGQGHEGRDHESLVFIGQRPDNNQPLFAHRRCLPFVTMVKGPSFDNLHRGSSQENIWAFASRFKYFTAASDTDGIPSTVQETFPTADMPKEEPAMTTEVKQKTSDGAPVPPKPF